MSARARRVVVSLVVALLSGMATMAFAAGSPDETEAGFLAAIAQERGARSLAGYTLAEDLSAVARRHAADMARQQRLHHNPRLGNEVQDWQQVGENVGVGPSVEEIHAAFMRSSTHRAEILSRSFTEVGIGVALDDQGSIWVAEVFRKRMPAPAAPAAQQETRVAPVRASRAVPAARPATPAAAPAAAQPVAAVVPAEPAIDLDALEAALAVPVVDQPSADLAVRTISYADTTALPVLPDPKSIPLPVKVAATMLLAVVAAQVAMVRRLQLLPI
jgi:hypothetical protein